MRYVLALFVVIFGLGAMAINPLPQPSLPIPENVNNDTNPANPILPTLLPVLTQVDRDDDPAEMLPCTEAPRDCSLRSAIQIANNDGSPTTITFADHYLISLNQPLPALSEDGTIIRAAAGQEIHVKGNDLPGAIFDITGANVTVDGLHIYGAGAGYANIMISGTAFAATIANNIIGDDDAPSGNCGQNNQAYAGIYINAHAADSQATHAWIYGNIIECHTGAPGVGILVATEQVVIGHDGTGCAGFDGNNTIRWNQIGVNLGDNGRNTVCHALIHDNVGGGLQMTNFNNDIMENEIR